MLLHRHPISTSQTCHHLQTNPSPSLNSRIQPLHALATTTQAPHPKCTATQVHHHTVASWLMLFTHPATQKPPHHPVNLLRHQPATQRCGHLLAIASISLLPRQHHSICFFLFRFLIYCINLCFILWVIYLYNSINGHYRCPRLC